jgi:hypothetical protein
MVIGGVEVAHQYPTEGVTQGLIHYSFIPPTTQEVPLRGSAEGPHIAIGPLLTPTGFVSVYHRTGSDTLHYPFHCFFGLPGAMLYDLDDAPHAQLELMHRL